MTKLASFLARPLAALGLLLATAGAAQAQSFAPVMTYGTGSIPQDIVASDVNGDGRLDLITANSNSNSVGVLIGSATTPGTFPATATFYGSGGNFPVGLGVGDVNGDGYPDIVVGNSSSNNVSVLLGSATTPGTFLAAVSYGSGTSTPRGLGLIDLNGDGRLDIVVGGNNTIGVLFNLAATPGTFGPAATYATGVTADGIAVGDVNGDGRPDVAVTGYQTANTITVLLNSATTPGTFPALVAYSSGGVTPRGVTLADVNGDGRADIIVGNEASNTVGVLLNLAATPGTFGAAATYSSGASGPDGVRVRDMDGDSRPDIVATNYQVSSGVTVSVLLNSATTLGTFATGTTYSSGGQGPVGLALGDLNNDGRPDIAATNVLSSTVGVLLNTTIFNFPTLTSISPVSGPVGTSITLTGTNLTGATAVSFNGTAATTFAVVNATTVTATVPAGATSGNVTVTTGSGISNGVAFSITFTATTWTGAVSTDWFTAANWTSGVPTNAVDGTIPAGAPRYPGISAGTASTLALTLDAGATLSQSGGTLQTNGDFTTNGTFAATGGTVMLGGTSGRRLLGSASPRFWNLTIAGNAVAMGSPAGARVQRLLALTANLTTNGNPLLLESDANGTAMIVNQIPTAIVDGFSVSIQRYISPDLNPGPGYRHLATPTNSFAGTATTFGGLATGSFTPVVNPAYNASATPGTTTPFPNIFAYTQSRLASASNNLSAFDKGWESPGNLSGNMQTAAGYTVNLSAGQTVTFTGLPTAGDGNIPLSRNAGGTANDADAGWNLMGNPYPSPYDYSLQTPADRPRLDAAIYVFESTGQYGGNYRSYANGVGGSPILAMGQGFFARVSAGQTSGSINFRNANRVTTYQNPTYHRSTTDTRPLVQLELRGATGPADALYAYAEAGATPAFDSQFDAEKITNPTGLNLSSTATSSERLAIDGRPVFDATTQLPLNVGVPVAGTYTLTAAALSNLPAGLDAYLHDAQTGQTVSLRTQPSYSFGVSAAQATALLTGRFSLRFSATALAKASALTAAQVALYPNPAHVRFTVLMPGVTGATTVQAELVNALGQVVRRQLAALPASGTTLTVETGELAAGVYTMRLLAGPTTLAKRVVIQ